MTPLAYILSLPVKAYRLTFSSYVARVNCHPFTVGKWSFAHNGQIADFARIRRQLENLLPDALYNHRRGTTDSELLFLMCLANGLDTNPAKAIETTLKAIRTAQGDTKNPNRLACVFTDGQTVYGFRHASDHASPTLYLSGSLTSGGTAMASEPLCGDTTSWDMLAEDELVDLSPQGIKRTKLALHIPEMAIA